MRVVHAVQSRTFAGTERHILGIGAEQRRLGLDVAVACPASATQLIHRAQDRGLTTLELDRPWRLRPFDVIHVHDGRSALLGALAARRSAAGFVRTQHFVRPATSERSGALARLSLAGHRLINARLDAYICVSADAARAATERRDTTAQLTVIPPGIQTPDPSAYAAITAARSATANPTVLSAGRVEAEREFGTLIRAIPQVLGEHPGARFIISGAGSDLPRLKALSDSLGVASAIRWTGWLDELTSVFSEAHLYVNTWPWEGFGMATAEAMAAGLPVVVAASGAAPELVAGGVGGWIVPPSDPDALAGAIQRAFADPAATAAVGAQGRVRAVERYGVSAAAAAIVALYEQILAQRTARNPRQRDPGDG